MNCLAIETDDGIVVVLAADVPADEETRARRAAQLCPAGAITADVTGMAIGDTITVGDLAVPENVEIVTDAALAVATVSAPRLEEPAEGVAPAAPDDLTPTAESDADA